MLIDVRTPKEFAEAHLVGAINIELSADMASRLPAEAKDQTLELYCRSGGRAGQAEETLRAAGYQTKNIGGIDELVAGGYTIYS